jgi:GDP-L-fucose synthase
MKVLIFGSNGLVGSNIAMKLEDSKENIEVIKSTRDDTNLFSLIETKRKITTVQPDIIINAAAKVGGINANNTQRFSFILDNLKINTNIFEAVAGLHDIKIINIGSSCIYPLNAENPITEESIMTGKLEPTNSPYSMAKLSAVELGRALKYQYGNDVINIMPTNIYGPNDHFNENNSHVIPGLIYKMHNAVVNQKSQVEIWGSGKPLREFMHVQDLASAVLFLIKNEVTEDLLNIGTGEEISIKELSKEIQQVTKFNGELIFNNSFPDGNPRKLLDSSKMLKLGWQPEISLKEGLADTYSWFTSNY